MSLALCPVHDIDVWALCQKQDTKSDTTLLVLGQRLSQTSPGTISLDQVFRLVTALSLHSSVKVLAVMGSTAWCLFSCLLLGVVTQELQKEADPALNCRQQERAKVGDRIILDYTGLLDDGSTFDRGSADFVIGDKTVIRGLEEGMLDQCAGEKITMIVPPSLGNIETRTRM